MVPRDLVKNVNGLALRSMFFAIFGTLIGCGPSGPEVVPVTGTLTLDDRPLPDVQLTFHPINGTAGHGAGGSTDGQGRFTLKAMVPGTTEEYDGAIPGEYRVTAMSSSLPNSNVLEARDDTHSEEALTPRKPQGSPFPAIYSSEESPAIVVVGESGEDLDVRFSSRGPK